MKICFTADTTAHTCSVLLSHYNMPSLCVTWYKVLLQNRYTPKFILVISTALLKSHGNTAIKKHLNTKEEPKSAVENKPKETSHLKTEKISSHASKHFRGIVI